MSIENNVDQSMSVDELQVTEEAVQFLSHLRQNFDRRDKSEDVLEDYLNHIVLDMDSNCTTRKTLCEHYSLRDVFEVFSFISNTSIVISLLKLCIYALQHDREGHEGVSNKYDKNSFLVKNLMETLEVLLDNFSVDADVVCHVCKVLNILFTSMEDLNLSNQLVGKLVRAMKINIADELCITDIAHILSRSSERTITLTKMCILLQDLPLRALSLHLDHHDVVSSLLPLLTRLTLDEASKSVFMKHQIVTLLLELSSRYEADKVILVACMRIVMNLAAASVERASVLGSQNICELVVTIAKKFPNEDLLLIVACDVITELLLPEGHCLQSNKEVFLECGCLDMLLGMLREDVDGLSPILLLRVILVIIFLCKPFTAKSFSEDDWQIVLRTLVHCVAAADQKYHKSVIRLILWLLEDDVAREKCEHCGLFAQMRNLFLQHEFEEVNLILMLRCVKYSATTQQGLQVMASENVLSKICKLFDVAMKQQNMDLVKEVCICLRVLCVNEIVLQQACLRDVTFHIVDILSTKTKNMKLADETFKLFRKFSQSPALRKEMNRLGIRSVLKKYNLAKYIMECIIAEMSIYILVLLILAFSACILYLMMYHGWKYVIVFLLLCRYLALYTL